MIQPLNLCRQLIQPGVMVYMSKELSTADHEGFRVALPTIAKEAIKFLLPVNGDIMADAEYRALDSTLPLALPYPTIALEYPVVYSNDNRRARQIVFAAEIDTPPNSLVSSARSISCATLVRIDGESAWTFVAPVQIPTLGALVRGVDGVKIGPEVCCTQTLTEEDKTGWQGVYVLLGFLNALACSNVVAEKIALSPVRVAMRKAIPFDTYHMLTLDIPNAVPKGAGTGGGIQGSGRHTREHLRRGHVRRYQTGRVIWVNACVVSADSIGKITKEYALRRAS